MQRLCQRNFQALQDINLGGSTNATGLILSKVDHKSENTNQVFGRDDGELKAYNLSIWTNNNNAVRLHQK